jgi:chromosome segregation ATPase
MSEEALLQAFKEHREESRAEFSKLDAALEKLSDATAQLAQAVVRMEERHERHDEAMRRMGKQIDDHENRVRVLEKIGHVTAGGIKTLLGIAGFVGAIVALVVEWFAGN